MNCRNKLPELPKHLKELFETAKAHGLTFEELKQLAGKFSALTPYRCQELMEQICSEGKPHV